MAKNHRVLESWKSCFCAGLFLFLGACEPLPPDVTNVIAAGTNTNRAPAPAENPQLAGRLSAVGLSCTQVLKIEPYPRDSSEMLVTCSEDQAESKEVQYVYNPSKGTARLPQADQ